MEREKTLSLETFEKKKINILWDSYIEDKNNISLLFFIDQNSKKIKDKYLNLIDKISLCDIDNKNFYEIFKIKKDFSYWWMTETYEKSLYKQEKICEILKLLALEEIFKLHKIKKIITKNFPRLINNSIKEIAQNNQFDFHVEKQRSQGFNMKIFQIIFSLLNFIRFVSKRYSFKKTKLKNLKLENFFCSYFAYIDKERLKKGEYKSSYWGELENYGIIDKTYFAHIFFPSNKLSYSDSIEYLKKINIKSSNKHFFVEEFFSFQIFFKTIYFWIKNILKFIKIKSKLIKSLKKKDIFVSDFIKENIEEDFYKTNSLVNFYYFFIFEKISSKFNNLKKTFYLYENQGWEKSFVYNFNKINNNEIYAVQNSTVRFWDLRFFNTENKKIAEIEKLFQPSFYLTNGKDSYEQFIVNGYQANKIKSVEAIRYYELMKYISSSTTKNSKKNSVLILGDYSIKSNLSISKTINKLGNDMTKNFVFTVKEHPLRKMSNLLNIEFKRSNKPLKDLIESHQFAIVGNTTSAAVDLYLLGCKVIVIIDEDFINFSPLKNKNGVFFLYNNSNLARALTNFDENKLDIKDKKKTEFFYYNKDYKLWNEILNNNK